MNDSRVQTSMNGQGVIISRPGVGYNKKYGISIPEHPANRIFYVRNGQESKLYELIEHVGTEYVFVAEKIMQYAEKNLEKNLNPSLLLILADHISSAISQAVSGVQISNVFPDEIKVLYEAKYTISCNTLTIINEQFSVQLPGDETGFIVLHILNNYGSSVDHESVRIIELSRIITELIEVVYNRRVGRSSFNYSRFMIHLKYFSDRVLYNRKIKQRDIGDIYEQFLEKNILL